jgi:hypothetical protein
VARLLLFGSVILLFVLATLLCSMACSYNRHMQFQGVMQIIDMMLPSVATITTSTLLDQGLA